MSTRSYRATVSAQIKAEVTDLEILACILEDMAGAGREAIPRNRELAADVKEAMGTATISLRALLAEIAPTLATTDKGVTGDVRRVSVARWKRTRSIAECRKSSSVRSSPKA